MTASTSLPSRQPGFFARRWLTIFNSLVGLYVVLPILAPSLMSVGLERPARLIYTLYSPMCHQMAFRSFFLFGEQAAYPRELAGVAHITPFEAYAHTLPEFEGIPADDWVSFFAAARRFVGNMEMGYKLALCERDIAIFGALLVGGLAYGVARRRWNITALPIVWFAIIGMGPIALDGFSQLLGYYGLTIPWIAEYIPLRESTPFLRTATGAWFGLCVAWLALPQLDAGVRDLTPPAPAGLRPKTEGSNVSEVA